MGRFKKSKKLLLSFVIYITFGEIVRDITEAFRKSQKDKRFFEAEDKR